MSFGKNKNRQSSQASSSLDPQIRAAHLSNVNRAQGIAGQAFTPFTGPRFADFDPAETNAQNRLLSFANSNVGDGMLMAAEQTARRASAYQPVQVNASSYSPVTTGRVDPITYQPAQAASAGVSFADAANAGEATTFSPLARDTIRDVTTGAISPDQISAYMNPYTDEVVRTSLADLERQRAEREAINNSRAMAEGAFGGSGASFAAALDNDRFDREIARTGAELRSQGFQTALSAAQQDAGRGLQAGIANQGADVSFAGMRTEADIANARARDEMARYNAGLGQQTNLANADASNRASLANADATTRVSQSNAQGFFDAASRNAGLAQEANLTDAAEANLAGRFNAERLMEAQRLNQSAGLESQQLQLAASETLGRLSQQQVDQALQRIEAEGNVGAARRELQQALLDFGFEQYEAEQMWPFLGQELVNQALGTMGNPTLTTSRSTGRSSGFNIGFPVGSGSGG